jgi:hypothetical protein
MDAADQVTAPIVRCDRATAMLDMRGGLDPVELHLEEVETVPGLPGPVPGRVWTGRREAGR